MPFNTENPLANLETYGPKIPDRASDLEQEVALANNRPARSPETMNDISFMAKVGNRNAVQSAKQLVQEARELGNQYKREARGMNPDSDSMVDKIRKGLGFKHGGKVSTASANKKQPRW